ncbi:hypothetical protein Peur_017749 [Populus x canadensis]
MNQFTRQHKPTRISLYYVFLPCILLYLFNMFVTFVELSLWVWFNLKMVSPHLRFREISGDPNEIVRAIPDTERYIAAIASHPHSSHSSGHGRGQLLLQVHKMEVDGSETLKLVGVLVH